MEFSYPVIIVDDEDLLREPLSSNLKRRGFQVFSAGNGDDALRILEPFNQSCFLLVDLMMPGVDGWELISLIRAHAEKRNLKHHVIVISGSLAAKEIAHQESTAYLPKPFMMKDLTELLRAIAGE